MAVPKSQPIMIIQTSKRDQGRTAQRSNIEAGQLIASIIRTTLGPRAMIKMLLDPMGGITLTTDGNAILREIDVGQPGAKTLIELSRAQDEETGDGTTSVVLLAGELLGLALPLLDNGLHPCQIVAGYLKALEDALIMLDKMAIRLNINDEQELEETIMTCLKTKFSSRWGYILPKLAIKAAKYVSVDLPNKKKSIDIKKYARIEKVPGGDPEDCSVLQGIMVNKDIIHPKMRRYIKNPKVILLDSPLEYKKGESQTNVEITDEKHFDQLLKQEEDEVKQMCMDIIKIGCDVVVTEKGVSDLAQHYFVKAGITVLRRVRKSDNNRLARVTGATIVSRTSELRTEDVGCHCGLFEVKKIGDEFYAYFIECKYPTACTIILRGGSKDILNEVERNLQDVLCIARNLLLDPRILPGGGATELALSQQLSQKCSEIKGVQQCAYKALKTAFEIIPQTLIQNCGSDVVRTITILRSKHATAENCTIGIDGVTGEIVDVAKSKIWDTFATKQQLIKAATEAASMLIRIDDILSATTQKKKDEAQSQPEKMPDL